MLDVDAEAGHRLDSSNLLGTDHDPIPRCVEPGKAIAEYEAGNGKMERADPFECDDRYRVVESRHACCDYDSGWPESISLCLESCFRSNGLNVQTWFRPMSDANPKENSPVNRLPAIPFALAAFFISAPMLALAQPKGAAPAAALVRSFPAKNLKWIEIAGTGGIKYANVSGNLTGKGPYEAFVTFPAGKANPFHLHTQALPTVVMKGTFYAVIDGKRTEYPAGSFYRLPARLPHYSGCVDGEDCLLFQYQADHFDLVQLDEVE
jgi:quercetin dioxygenase-like cupin family protein